MSKTSPLLLVLVLFSTASSFHAQTGAGEPYKCGFTKEVLDPLVDEAERKQFNVRRVEIAGSAYTRDRAFRKRMVVGMTEGDIFTRAALERSVRNIGKMKEVYPITLQDVEVRLNREDKVIDVVICVIQKPRLL